MALITLRIQPPLIRYLSILITAGSLLNHGAAWAEDASKTLWPDHAIRFIVSFPPGGATDIISREVAARLQDSMKQPVVVENIGGASGSIGVGRIAKAKNDGYTIGLGNSGTFTMTPYLQTVPYDPRNDFTPISMLTEYSNVLVVGKKMKAHSLAEFIKEAQSSPQALTYGSAGNGSSNHMTGVLFGNATKLKFLHVPYRGNNPALLAVMGGQLDWMFATISEIKPFLESGKLRALGVSSLQPDPLLPSVPPINHAVPGFNVIGFMGLFAPADIPAYITSKLSNEVNQILTNRQVIEKFSRLGMRANPSSPEKLAKRVDSDGAIWKKAIADGQVTTN
ncbi:MAG TPA: hypothetical protein DD666_21015 [Advenella kashmirensis]|uniref:Tripartite tricarboxylate transporter substrate binding protein n=1 Tax=Advenella kashmirensis TaxID=310575 RepID=A0A356LLL2_9BURK|nr:hypothetical protein [Advenella kashmirensis]